ncbi:MAG: hypothetical protein RIT22_2073 [Bacteroidota bacterium]
MKFKTKSDFRLVILGIQNYFTLKMIHYVNQNQDIRRVSPKM